MNGATAQAEHEERCPERLIGDQGSSPKSDLTGPRRFESCPLRNTPRRTALVTGSAQGIGLAIATGLARAGARVVVNGRGEERVADAVRTVRAGSGSEDVTGAAGDLATERGAADVLRAVPALDDAEWRRHFEVNVLSAVRLVRAYLPGMKERGWGRILDLASDSAVAVPAEMTTGVIHWQLVAVRENQVADDCGST